MKKLFTNFFGVVWTEPAAKANIYVLSFSPILIHSHSTYSYFCFFFVFTFNFSSLSRGNAIHPIGIGTYAEVRGRGRG